MVPSLYRDLELMLALEEIMNLSSIQTGDDETRAQFEQYRDRRKELVQTINRTAHNIDDKDAGDTLASNFNFPGDRIWFFMANKLTDEGREKVRQALKKKGLKVVRESKKEAPVDTGRLRSNITLNVLDNTGNLPKVLVGTNVDYAKDVEFGTVKQPPQPYLRPALSRLKAGQL